MYGFSPLWLRRCKTRVRFSLNVAPQSPYLENLSRSWQTLVWWRNWDNDENHRGQYSHSCGYSRVWWRSAVCFCGSENRLKNAAQWQTYGLVVSCIQACDLSWTVGANTWTPVRSLYTSMASRRCKLAHVAVKMRRTWKYHVAVLTYARFIHSMRRHYFHCAVRPSTADARKFPLWTVQQRCCNCCFICENITVDKAVTTYQRDNMQSTCRIGHWVTKIYPVS